MIKYRLIFILVFFLIFCAEEAEEITGTNTLEQVESSRPSILADGVSTVDIIATVYDSSQKPITNIPVQFSSSHGNIDERVMTNANGQAIASLTSSASTTDITATVTVTLPDSTQLQKSAFTQKTVTLKAQQVIIETNNANEEEATISVLFIGVTLSATLKKEELPADGLSQTELNMVIKETTSKRAVPHAKLSLRSAKNTIPAEVFTDNSGVATASITALAYATTDTIYIDYGNTISKLLFMDFITPSIRLEPKTATLMADGNSQLQLTATLTSHNNNPIPGAEIHFSTDKGVVTSSAKTNEQGRAIAQYSSNSTVKDTAMVVAVFHDISDTSRIALQESSGKKLSVSGPPEVLRNGVSQAEISARVFDQNNNPVANSTVQFSAQYGDIEPTAKTDLNGYVTLPYTPDAGSTDVIDTLTVSSATSTVKLPLLLRGILLQISVTPDSILANGIENCKLAISLKESQSHKAIAGATVSLSTTLGTVNNELVTDYSGEASTTLTSGTKSGSAIVTAKYGLITDSTRVQFVSEQPNTILLSANPSFIWVKETGELDQTIIAATILTQTGTSISNEVAVRFRLRNGPGGGESISPAAPGSTLISEPIRTVNGTAKITLKSGIRSGTVEIEAELVDFPEVHSRTTNVTIRSGPPYIWIDPGDKNNVETHMTVALDVFNLEGWNHVRQFNVSLYAGDKYNNPVEQGTSIYLTSTAGIITTDVVTDARGEGSAILTTANPRPYVNPSDPVVLAPHRIPNPNDEGMMLPITVPDFEFNGVENDGIAYIIASTHGRDQNGNDAVVFATHMAVFSGSIAVFDISSDRDSLDLGEVATISIVVYDINGNPPARGSTLTADASNGEISNSSLMPTPERYGYGATFFQTQLLNDLDPVLDKAGMAKVNIKLDSPNGVVSEAVYIYLSKDNP
ncbi:hypothetical protein GF407_18870 [candidate division KSB1 bacterium]|nr:hypothetical protein [candidate division KSB1 bacterium]